MDTIGKGNFKIGISTRIEEFEQVCVERHMYGIVDPPHLHMGVNKKRREVVVKANEVNII